MPNPFEIAMAGAVRQIVDSALGGSVTYTQAEAEFSVNATWRQGDSLEQQVPQIAARAFVALADFEEAPRAMPARGDRITKDGRIYEVRRVALDGVGGCYLDLRFIQEAP